MFFSTANATTWVVQIAHETDILPFFSLIASPEVGKPSSASFSEENFWNSFIM